MLSDSEPEKAWPFKGEKLIVLLISYLASVTLSSLSMASSFCEMALLASAAKRKMAPMVAERSRSR